MGVGELSASEQAELQTLHDAFFAARDRRDFVISDALRMQLSDWGAVAPSYSTWHPVFESVAHRASRLAARVDDRRP